MAHLKELITPRSIAIIGANDKKGSYGCRASENIVNSRLSDHIYYVNPKREELFGRKCYKSLDEIPEPIDLAIYCIPAAAVPDALDTAGKAGIRAAVVYASGFSEAQTQTGMELEQKLAETAAKYDMSVNGPNTSGIINKIDNISMTVGKVDFHDPPLEQGLGIVCQSGFIAGNTGQMLSSSIAYCIGSGNGCVTTLEDYLDFYADNPHVSTIGVYLEGIKDADQFEKALYKAAKNRKPVVILKSGKSEKGARAAASHTGNLAGSYAACESVFRKYGVIATDSLEEFVSTCRMLQVTGGNIPDKPGAAILNFSGGENAISADMCDKYRISLAEYSEETKNAVQENLPLFASVANPLDATTDLFASADKLEGILRTLDKDPGVGYIVIGSEMNINPEKKDQTLLAVFRKINGSGNKLRVPVYLIPSFERTRNTEYIHELEQFGVAFLSTGETGYKSLGNLGKYIGFHAEKIRYGGSVPDRKKNGRRVNLSETESKKALEGLGVPFPETVTVKEKKDLRNLPGLRFPAAMKIDSPDILHKTDAGGVRLSVACAQEAETAFDEIMASCRTYKPDAVINGIQIQEMVPEGIEMIVGTSCDPQFGHMLLAGLGGVFVELFKDVSMAPCPVSKDGAIEMLKTLKGYKILQGYRGSGECDIEALAELMVKVSEYAAENKDTLIEMDLNPVYVYEKGKGLCAVDAMVSEYR